MDFPALCGSVSASHCPWRPRTPGKQADLALIRRWADRCPVGPSFNEKPRWTSVFTATKHEPQDAKRKAEKGDASRLGYCCGGYWRIEVNTPIAGNVADASVVVRSAATNAGPRSSECGRREARSRNDSRDVEPQRVRTGIAGTRRRRTDHVRHTSR